MKYIPQLIMLIGLPGAGKSYWKNNNDDVIFGNEFLTVLSTDNYIEQVAKETDSTYNDVWKANIKLAEKNLELMLLKAIEKDNNIVWDQTNLTPKVRAKKLARIPDYYAKHAVLFLTDNKLIESVNEERKQFGRNLPDHVLQSMMESFNTDTINEEFDTVDVVYRGIE